MPTPSVFAPEFEFDETTCLCGSVPKDKRVDYERKVQDKEGRYKWKAYLRVHIDCPVHGVTITRSAKDATGS